MTPEQRRNLGTGVQTEYWAPPRNEGDVSDIFRGRTFQIYLYHIPPFAIIDDWEARSGDPGNVEQSRTPANGRISGLTVEFLVEIESLIGANFHWLYPCRPSDVTAIGQCLQPTRSAAFDMLRGPDLVTEYCNNRPGPECALYYGGAKYDRNMSDPNPLPGTLNTTGVCEGEQCFVAGAVKVQEEQLEQGFLMSATYMDRGFKLVVKEKQVQADFMAWAAPFSPNLWGLIGVEIIFCAICFMYTEGGSKSAQLPTNPSLPSRDHLFPQFMDCVYWAITILLGAADKAPITNSGRTMIIAHLFFALIILSVYTGNINSFLLNIPTEQAIEQFQDLVDVSSTRYRAGTRVCASANQRSIGEYLDAQAIIYPDANLVRVEATDIDDCLLKVYLDEADCTFFDDPVVLERLSTQFYQKGMCGNPGGYCSNSSFYDEVTCTCEDEACSAQTGHAWTPVDGSLITTGEMFKPFGYGFGFRPPAVNSSLWSVPMSQVISYLREQGVSDALSQRYIPEVESLQCAGTDPDEEVVQLDVINLLGLLYITAALTAVGVAVGSLETLLRIFMWLCPCFCNREGASVVTAYQDLLQKWEEEREEEEEERRRLEERPEIVYVETDLDDPDAGARTRLDPVHRQLSDLHVRLVAVERRILRGAKTRALLTNDPDLDEEPDPPALHARALHGATAGQQPPVQAAWLADASASARSVKPPSNLNGMEGAGVGQADLVYKKAA